MNYQLQQLIQELEPKAQENRLWFKVLEDVMKPTRSRRVVNLYKINKCAQEGETIVVPGKVLSVGDINKKVVVAAMNFSAEAQEKITQAKGKTMSISQLLKENPDGKKVRILG